MKKIFPALQRRLKHPFSRWQRLYTVENPWGFDRPFELFRFEQTNRIIREAIGPVETILEIGAAEGHQTKYLLDVARKVHGVDISATAVERAGRAFANNPNVSFSVGSLPDIRVNERFDLVTALEIIYYVKPKEMARALDTMERLSKKRLVSVHWPRVSVLETHLFPSRSVTKEILYWEGNPMWLVAWW